jgi:peptidoglycan/LPS O-acetylase OafA/YrhL
VTRDLVGRKHDFQPRGSHGADCPMVRSMTASPNDPDAVGRTSHSSSLAARRSESLDAVRAIACVMVITSHVSLYRGDSSLLGLRNGVMVFFALSGYLLFRPFLRGSVDLRSYALHRVARILPAYVVALVGITILTGDRTFLEHPLAFAFFLQNYDRDLWQGFLGVSWTLVLEVQFYVTLPLLAVLVRGSISRLMLIALGSIAINLVALLLDADRFSLSGYPFMIWAFVPGMLAALIEDRGVRWIGHPAVLAAGVVSVAVGTGAPWFSIDIASGVGSGLIVAWCVARRPSLGPAARLASVGAALTYSAYLWHVDFIKVAPSVPIALLATAAVAGLIYVSVERSVMRLGRMYAWAHRRWADPVTVPTTG